MVIWMEIGRVISAPHCNTQQNRLHNDTTCCDGIISTRASSTRQCLSRTFRSRIAMVMQRRMGCMGVYGYWKLSYRLQFFRYKWQRKLSLWQLACNQWRKSCSYDNSSLSMVGSVCIQKKICDVNGFSWEFLHILPNTQKPDRSHEAGAMLQVTPSLSRLSSSWQWQISLCYYGNYFSA